eukprot:SAG25_NODE_9618_length_365_cov_0.781955_1_plen_99_part_01
MRRWVWVLVSGWSIVGAGFLVFLQLQEQRHRKPGSASRWAAAAEVCGKKAKLTETLQKHAAKLGSAQLGLHSAASIQPGLQAALGLRGAATPQPAALGY